MSLIKGTLLAVSLIIISSCSSHQPNKPGLEVVFQEDNVQFLPAQKRVIHESIAKSEKEVRNLLPVLPADIKVIVEIVDWDLDKVGGVTGRTETNSPAIVAIQLSEKFNGGISSAIEVSLESTIYHEFHHLSRGWAIQDNQFEPGISIAMVNEGLAVVFAEEYTGGIFEENHIPEEVDGDAWVKEILALPKYADYQEWMFEHPDGRTSIGYRSGSFLIRKVMADTGKNILELSRYSPKEIIKLAGY